MPNSYDTALDIAFCTLDFLWYMLMLPVKAIAPNLPGVDNRGPNTLGGFFGASKQGETEKNLELYALWGWVALVALVLLFV
jgi:hypothetical protein